MIPSLNTFLFDPFLSFNYVLSFEPSFIPKHVIVSIWDVFSAGTAFLRFFSFNQFFWNDPASVRKILVEFGFLAIFELFEPYHGLWIADFWLNYAVFWTFQTVDRPKTCQNRV